MSGAKSSSSSSHAPATSSGRVILIMTVIACPLLIGIATHKSPQHQHQHHLDAGSQEGDSHTQRQNSPASSSSVHTRLGVLEKELSKLKNENKALSDTVRELKGNKRKNNKKISKPEASSTKGADDHEHHGKDGHGGHQQQEKQTTNAEVGGAGWGDGGTRAPGSSVMPLAVHGEPYPPVPIFRQPWGKPHSTAYISNLLASAKLNADKTYDKLLQLNSPEEAKNFLVVEVGSFDGKQAVAAVKAGYNLLVLEPSPKNFQRSFKRVKKFCAGKCTPETVQILQIAGSSHEHTVQMAVTGSTGDHIVGQNRELALGEEVYMKKHTMVSIPAKPVDAFLAPTSGTTPTTKTAESSTTNGDSNPAAAAITPSPPKGHCYILKIDVQDHEPMVFKGMDRLLDRKVPDFILIEYRPQGWAHMFKDEKLNPSEVLTKLCTDYDCYYQGRMSHKGHQHLEYQFADDWIAPTTASSSTHEEESSGKKQQQWLPLTELTDRLYSANMAIADDFGAWTDILAVARREDAKMKLLKLCPKCVPSDVVGAPAPAGGLGAEGHE